MSVKVKVLAPYKLGWKVLDRGTRHSAWIHADGLTLYVRGKAVRRREGFGPYAVFSSKQRAASFARDIEGTVVQCAYRESQDKTLWTPTRRCSPQQYPFPLGTRFADEVLCLE
jgi:hypothetical protein